MVKDEGIAVRLLRWANHIQAIAGTGMSFTENLHDRLRYQELQEIAIEMLASVNGTLEYDVEFAKELAQTLRREAQSGVLGYVTPKVGVAAAVFDQSDRILLVQPIHSKGWSLPGGWAEEKWTPAENAQREVLEETGLVVRPRALLGVFDSRLHPFETTVTSYNLLFECELLGGELKLLEDEIATAGYHAEEFLPRLISGVRQQVRVAFSFHKLQLELPFFDR